MKIKGKNYVQTLGDLHPGECFRFSTANGLSRVFMVSNAYTNNERIYIDIETGALASEYTCACVFVVDVAIDLKEEKTTQNPPQGVYHGE